MINQQNLIWASVLTWITLCTFYILLADLKLSVIDLVKLLPEHCTLSELIGNNNIVLKDPKTICFYFLTTTILLTMVYFYTAEDDVENLAAEIVDLTKNVEEVTEETTKDETLTDAVETLLDYVGLEYNHYATILTNDNDTRGLVGGEAEWATGETSSEEDATHEVTGARIRKRQKELDEEEMLKYLETPFDKRHKSNIYEPNLRSSKLSKKSLDKEMNTSNRPTI